MELAPPDLVAVAAQAGYDSVGLRFIPVAGQTLPRFDVAEVERRLRDTGVRVLDLEVFRIAPETRVGDFEPALAVAQRLGASELLAHGADADFSRLADRFGALCDLAARYRLAVNLEPMPWVEVANVAKAKRVLDAANRPNSALLVDAIHFFRAGDRFDEIPRKLNYAQLCDARAERPADLQEIIRQARGDRLFPGEGGLDLQGLVRALPPDLPISVEIPYAKPMSPLERAQRALAATRKLLACASPS
jgi:sugar phosphate isomerase/epimerase